MASALTGEMAEHITQKNRADQDSGKILEGVEDLVKVTESVGLLVWQLKVPLHAPKK